MKKAFRYIQIRPHWCSSTGIFCCFIFLLQAFSCHRVLSVDEYFRPPDCSEKLLLLSGLHWVRFQAGRVILDPVSVWKWADDSVCVALECNFRTLFCSSWSFSNRCCCFSCIMSKERCWSNSTLVLKVRSVVPQRWLTFKWTIAHLLQARWSRGSAEKQLQKLHKLHAGTFFLKWLINLLDKNRGSWVSSICSFGASGCSRSRKICLDVKEKATTNWNTGSEFTDVEVSIAFMQFFKIKEVSMWGFFAVWVVCWDELITRVQQILEGALNKSTCVPELQFSLKKSQIREQNWKQRPAGKQETNGKNGNSCKAQIWQRVLVFPGNQIPRLGKCLQSMKYRSREWSLSVNIHQ